MAEASKSTKPKVDRFGRAYGTGRRKSAVARVWVKVGSGAVVVNGVDFSEYFSREVLRRRVCLPFSSTSSAGYYDVNATVIGGGVSGQAGAVAHGISRALGDLNPALHLTLRKAGLLTRDSRVVERKKYGQHKARKKCQYSKR